MKNKILYIFIFLSGFGLSSCSDMLDISSPDGRVDNKYIFSTYSRVVDYVNNCKNSVLNVGMRYHGTTLGSFCDEAYDSKAFDDGPAIARWYKGETSSSYNPLDSDADYWVHYFQGINRCNTFLRNISDPSVSAPTTPFNPTEVQGWIAQVLVTRAYCYLQLIKRYGGVPILLTPNAVDHNYGGDSRASFEKCVDQIIKDCDDALAIPAPAGGIQIGFHWERKINRGDMSRAIAWAIKSQAALYAASPLWYQSGSKYTWAAATQITKEALDQCLANGYKLYDATLTVDQQLIGQNDYAYYFIVRPDYTAPWERETILDTRDDRMNVWQLAGLPVTDGMVTSGSCPTQELVDSYEVLYNGEAYPILDLSNPYTNDSHTIARLNPNLPGGAYDPANPYSNRDPRFEASIYYNESRRLLTTPDGANNRVYTHVGGNCGITSVPADFRNTHTGYYLRKFNKSTSNQTNMDDGFQRLFRLAELYLNFAEAANNSVGADVAVAGKAGQPALSAAGAVAAVRARVGMPAFPAGMSKADFELRYRNERRVELAFEEHRFFDVRRWKILDKTEGYVSGMKISGSAGSYVYERISLNPTRRLTAGDKYLMFPIKISEVNKMLKATGTNWQNPGW